MSYTLCIYISVSYLSVVAAIISEADYVFCPESPPPVDWPSKLCNKLIQASLTTKPF